MGMQRSSRELLFKPLHISEFRKKIADGLKNNIHDFDNVSQIANDKPAFRGIDQVYAARLDDPAESGWTFLINPNDEMSDEIESAIKPLAKLRGMTENDKPLYFDNVARDDWVCWINDIYQEYRISGKTYPPKYILIIGSPDHIPFQFQSLLSLQAYVGRLDFTHNMEKPQKISQLQTYVDKIKRLENNNPVEKQAIFFATDHGINTDGCYDPTHYNRLYMEKPLATDIRQMNDFKVIEITSSQSNPNQATKNILMTTLKTSKPALVFTASQSMNASGENIDIQNTYAGSIVCEGDRQESEDNWLITADSIPSDTSFVEGGVFFQYSDCSYGVPSTSYLNSYIADANTLGIPEPFADKDFVSAIPKKLLFNPKGPIAFIGHVDLELMLSYTDHENPMPDSDRDPRLAPFSSCLDSILHGRPVGFSLDSMIKNYGSQTISLATMHQKYIEQSYQDEEKFLDTLLDVFIRSTEAGNYMLMGDPAARLN